MAASLTNFIPFAFAMLDTAALVAVLVFIVRGLLRAVLGRRAYPRVARRVATAALVVGSDLRWFRRL
jgi:hypothetical protein